MKKTMKMKNKKISNQVLYEAIKKSLIDDLNKANEIFNDEIDNSAGVMLCLNTTKGFGRYLYNEPHKINELAKFLNSNVNFNVKIKFSKIGEEEFLPILER